MQGKYNEGTSNLLLVTVKSVQEVIDEAMEGLDDLRAELLALIAQKADLAVLNDKVAELNQKILDAEEAAELYADEQDAALEAKLTDAIGKAEAAAVEAANAAILRAKAELQALVDENAEKIAANTAEITKQVTLLNEAITNAEIAAKRYADSQDEAQYEKITGDIATAKREAIEAAQAALDAVEARLEALIRQNAENIEKNAEEIARQVEILSAMIALAEKTAKEYADMQDVALMQHLYQRIDDAKKDAVYASKLALDAARKELLGLIEAGDKAVADDLAAATDALNAAINAAEKAASAADAELKAEIEAEIEDARKDAVDADEALKTLLEGEIDRAQGEANEAAQSALDAAVKSLYTAITVLSIVAGLALVGVVALAILYFVPKKKV